MDFNTLYLELIDSANMIRALLTGVTQEEARAKPDPETWSILEVLCHLYDEEREDFRDRLDLILFRPNDEWRLTDPPGWVTSRRYNEQDFRTMKEKFFGERSRSLDWLKGLAEAEWHASRTAPFGTLTAGEVFCSWVAHDNLHLRQLVELRRSRLERITEPFSIAYAGDW